MERRDAERQRARDAQRVANMRAKVIRTSPIEEKILQAYRRPVMSQATGLRSMEHHDDGSFMADVHRPIEHPHDSITSPRWANCRDATGKPDLSFMRANVDAQTDAEWGEWTRWASENPEAAEAAAGQFAGRYHVSTLLPSTPHSTA